MRSRGSGVAKPVAKHPRQFRSAAKPWTTREIAELHRVAPLGAETASEVLGRSLWSVRHRAYRSRISLRRPGSRAGRILGQPRGARWASRNGSGRAALLRVLREDCLAGRADMARIERRIRLLARGAPLCPGCASRPQEIAATGLCEDCHLDRLAWGHRMERERTQVWREVDRERQRKHRRNLPGMSGEEEE